MIENFFLWESRCEDCEMYTLVQCVACLLSSCCLFFRTWSFFGLGEDGGMVRGGYNSIPIILVGRVLHLFFFAGEWGFCCGSCWDWGNGSGLGYC